jgi:RES domain-containing protein
MLVHGEVGSLPSDYIAIPVEIPDAVERQIVDSAGLPANWQEPGDAFCRALGDAWLDSGRSALLDAPSAVIPLEQNVILNPGHADAASLDTSHIG